MALNPLIRNHYCTPHLQTEGVFLKPIPVHEGEHGGEKWCSGLTPYERLFSYHTLASARKFAYFKPFSGLIPGDSLDFILDSPYEHSSELFPDHVDTLLQAETMGLRTWRRLKNSVERMSIPDPHANALVDTIGGFGMVSGRKNRRGSREMPYRYNDFHPVLISGLKEKRHPSNVKLMISTHHSPQTNAGYSRQDSDGTVFQY